ncbi:hypothetical protein AWH63_11040 [Marinobacter sp. C18]|uniref:hypothetical protein n=1 Tax=Marinobacter sp. C18 TaxID=1772288 RepID=UPI000948C55E|nr:hypothetical protein [Marinobacter sp. C18]OLF82067.1 hypothetical protein AWH63_11040 [Marinobacter sp. C18]
MPQKTQDPKYDIKDDRLINSNTGEPIPVNEPVFMFRGKDKNALKALKFYRDLCTDPEHIRAIDRRIAKFERFAEHNQDLMKEPDSHYS